MAALGIMAALVVPCMHEHKQFGQPIDDEARQHIVLSVAQGQVLGIVGRNGVGKTTTLEAIMGLVDVYTGTIAITGRARFRPQLEGLRRTACLVEEGLRIYLAAFKGDSGSTLTMSTRYVAALGELIPDSAHLPAH
jgi:ABC-type uncharacterized transport system ATPase subunit